jgi:dTMP kinase
MSAAIVKPGLLVSIEGGEGAGKSTVLQALHQVLLESGLVVRVTREPGGTPSGESIRQLLLDPGAQLCAESELLLMFASRAQLAHEVIRPALQRGECVLTDRFTDASFAYQGGGRGQDAARIAELERWAVGLRPDLTFLLDVGVEQGLQRARARGAGLDRIESEQSEFFERVRATYLARARREPGRFRVLDASLPAGEVAAGAGSALRSWLEGR